MQEQDTRSKLNCWDVMGCSRGIGDDTPCASDVCRAATETLVDGVNGGHNGGRACWAVAGSFAMDTPDCKRHGPPSCVNCPFFRMVITEELPNLEFSPRILETLGYANIFGPESEDWTNLDDPDPALEVKVEPGRQPR